MVKKNDLDDVNKTDREWKSRLASDTHANASAASKEYNLPRGDRIMVSDCVPSVRARWPNFQNLSLHPILVEHLNEYIYYLLETNVQSLRAKFEACHEQYLTAKGQSCRGYNVDNYLLFVLFNQIVVNMGVIRMNPTLMSIVVMCYNVIMATNHPVEALFYYYITFLAEFEALLKSLQELPAIPPDFIELKRALVFVPRLGMAPDNNNNNNNNNNNSELIANANEQPKTKEEQIIAEKTEDSSVVVFTSTPLQLQPPEDYDYCTNTVYQYLETFRKAIIEFVEPNLKNCDTVFLTLHQQMMCCVDEAKPPSVIQIKRKIQAYIELVGRINSTYNNILNQSADPTEYYQLLHMLNWNSLLISCCQNILLKHYQDQYSLSLANSLYSNPTFPYKILKENVLSGEVVDGNESINNTSTEDNTSSLNNTKLLFSENHDYSSESSDTWSNTNMCNELQVLNVDSSISEKLESVPADTFEPFDMVEQSPVLLGRKLVCMLSEGGLPQVRRAVELMVHLCECQAPDDTKPPHYIHFFDLVIHQTPILLELLIERVYQAFEAIIGHIIKMHLMYHCFEKRYSESRWPVSLNDPKLFPPICYKEDTYHYPPDYFCELYKFLSADVACLRGLNKEFMSAEFNENVCLCTEFSPCEQSLLTMSNITGHLAECNILVTVTTLVVRVFDIFSRNQRFLSIAATNPIKRALVVLVIDVMKCFHCSHNLNQYFGDSFVAPLIDPNYKVLRGTAMNSYGSPPCLLYKRLLTTLSYVAQGAVGDQIIRHLLHLVSHLVMCNNFSRNYALLTTTNNNDQIPELSTTFDQPYVLCGNVARFDVLCLSVITKVVANSRAAISAFHYVRRLCKCTTHSKGNSLVFPLLNRIVLFRIPRIRDRKVREAYEEWMLLLIHHLVYINDELCPTLCSELLESLETGSAPYNDFQLYFHLIQLLLAVLERKVTRMIASSVFKPNQNTQKQKDACFVIKSIKLLKFFLTSNHHHSSLYFHWVSIANRVGRLIAALPTESSFDDSIIAMHNHLRIVFLFVCTQQNKRIFKQHYNP